MSISPYAWPGMPDSLRSSITADQIIDAVCAHYDINPAVLCQSNRRRDIVIARNVCWHLMRRLMKRIYLTEMGRMFHKDHTTVIHGLRSIANDIDTDPTIMRDVEAIAAKIRSR